MKLLSTILFLICSLAGAAQLKYSINGKLATNKLDGQTIVLFADQTGRATDSTVVSNGKFSFQGSVAFPVRARLAVKSNIDNATYMATGTQADQQEFYLENTGYTVAGETLVSAIIDGGKEQQGYRYYTAAIAPYLEEMKPFQLKIRRYFQQKKADSIELMAAELRSIRGKINKEEDKFIAKGGDYYITLDLLNTRAMVVNEEFLEPLYNRLSPRLKATPIGKSISEKLANAKKVGVGTYAINFVQNDINGKPFNLSTLKGKYVLVDFWASWCGPCRKENPNVKVAYEKFKNKNFEILAVSLDNDKNAWLKAIEEDGLPWLQVSDLLGWKNEAAKLYDVRAVPQNFLIDPTGKIIAKDLKGESLDRKLTQLIVQK